MGSLAHLTGGMERVKEKLAQADAMGLNLSDMLGKKFAEVNENLGRNLKVLVEQAGNAQSGAFSKAVQDAVMNITQSQQIIINSNLGVLQGLLKLKEELSEEVEEVKSGVGSSSTSLSEQISVVAKGIERLPTSFPEAKEVDLSKVLNGIANLGTIVKAIPTEIPKVEKTDLSDIVKRLTALEDAIKKRISVFKVERINDQIDTIKVTTK